MIPILAASSAVLVVGAASSDPLLTWLAQAGAPGILAFIVIGFVKGWIVPGGEHKRVIEERDRALELVYTQATLAHRAVDVSAQRLSLQAEVLDRQRGRERDEEPRV